MQANGVSLQSPAVQPQVVKATVKDYIQMMKVGITVANVMAAFAGLWVGSHGHPSLLTTLLTLVGTALVVSGGATLNNFVDRDIDGRMERTSTRVVASGRIPSSVAFWMGLTLTVIGLLILAFGVNLVAAACAFAGIITYSYLYTVWFKRTTSLSTVWGGISGAMPPLIGWAAGSGGSLDVGAWVLFFTFFLWQPPHFLPLAMKRSEEYRAAGIPLLPVIAGFVRTKRQILIYTTAMFPVSLMLVPLHYEGVIYLIVMSILGLVFVGRAIQGLFVKDDIAWANKLFGWSLIYLTALCVVLVINPV